MSCSAFGAKKSDPAQLVLHEQDRPNENQHGSICQNQKKLRKPPAAFSWFFSHECNPSVVEERRGQPPSRCVGAILRPRYTI
jgi:hypothetical protein